MTGIIYIRIKNPDGQIDPVEWANVVTVDHELEPVDSMPSRDPVTLKVANIPTPNSARWVGHPDGMPFFFRFDDGVLDVGLLDEDGIRKAAMIAALLGARVEVSSE